MFSKLLPITLRQLSICERPLFREKFLSTMEASLNAVWSQMKDAAKQYAEVCVEGRVRRVSVFLAMVPLPSLK